MFFVRSFQALVTGSGFRGLHVLLAGEGIVRRLYREERLQVRRARRSQAAPRRYGHPSDCREVPLKAGAWISCRTRSPVDRRFRIFAVVDDFTRECLPLIAYTSLSSLGSSASSMRSSPSAVTGH
jgi:putative transposase